MATDTHARAGAMFELERLDVGGGELVISGQWSGVRGMRFMRPTLTVGTRRLLATLEHKPWAPEVDGPWIAAFPWSGGDVDAVDCWLDVAPGVVVPLARGAQRAPEVDEFAAQRLRFERRESEVEFLRGELRTLTAARDRALDQRDEAVRDREAAMRTRERMEGQRSDALDVAGQAQAAVAAAEAARDEAREQRDDARAQRDEALAAYRALEEQLRTLRAREAEPQAAEAAEAAEAQAAAPQAAQPPAAEPAPAEPPAEPAPDEPPAERPLGVRAVPAARAARIGRRPEYRLTAFDLYAFRIVGAIAAACFVVLMIALLQVFL